MELIAGAILLILLIFGEIRLYQKHGLHGVSYYCDFSDTEVTEGDTLTFSETLENAKALPIPWLKAELTLPKWLDFPESHSTVTGQTRFVTGFFSARGHAKVRRVWQVTCEKRGIYQVEHVVLVTADLLGAVRLSLPAKDTGRTLTVLPRRFSQTGLILPRITRFGEHPVQQHSQTDPCLSAGIRPYFPGDPRNRIHWKASAHTGSLLVRQEEPVAQQTITVLLNLQTRPTDSGTMTQDSDLQEHSIRVCAQCLWELCQNGWLVRLVCNARNSQSRLLETPYGGGKRMYHQTLVFLAKLSLLDPLSINQLLQQGRHRPMETQLLITPYTDQQVAAWKQQTDSFCLVTGHAHDAMHCADTVVPQ